MSATIESRCLAYISKIHATSGQGGHSATFSVACKIREFGLPFERAEIVFAWWNEARCHPKWTAAELRHKLVDAFRHATPRPEYMTAGKCGSVTPRTQTRPARSRPCVTDQEKADVAAREALIKSLLDGAIRPAPTSSSPLAAGIEAATNGFKTLKEARNISHLAQLRGVNRQAVQNAFWRGLVRFDNHNWKPAWFVLDRSLRSACARRMDGHAWFEETNEPKKAVMVKASQAKWPIGIREAEDYPNILLCEGGPDLLAAFHVTLGRSNEFAPVAMLSASCPIHTDALRLFKGKRVRIFAHNDQAGQQAATKWAKQIAGHVTAVDTFNFYPYGVNDLNEYVRGKFPSENLLQ